MHFLFVVYIYFGKVLQHLFIWRLKIEKPSIIILGIDTMVMDNDDAKCRHGVEPTYKKKNGFQPLQMNWGPYFIDAVFRGGSKHSNHGDTVQKMILHIVKKIRKQYNKDVPIIIRIDSGFFDQKIFNLCEELRIGYICGGKKYKHIVDVGENSKYGILLILIVIKIFGNIQSSAVKCNNWNKFRRTIYCRLLNRDKHIIFLVCVQIHP